MTAIDVVRRAHRHLVQLPADRRRDWPGSAGSPSTTCRPAGWSRSESSAGELDPRSRSLLVVGLPGTRGEVLREPQLGRQLDHRVAAVVTASTSTRCPWPPRCCPAASTSGAAPPMPDGALRPVGSGPGGVVVPGVPPPSGTETIHPWYVEQSPSLPPYPKTTLPLLRFNPVRCKMAEVSCPGGSTGLVEQDAAGVHVEPHEKVGGGTAVQHVGDGEDLASGRVDDGGAGDADGRARCHRTGVRRKAPVFPRCSTTGCRLCSPPARRSCRSPSPR